MKIAKFNGQPEIYYSIQGEGKSLGRPSVFVRLSVCNLNCVWCDTQYTWNWEKYKMTDEVLEVSVEEVAQKIKEFPCKNVVLTGGEPLLQQKELTDLMRTLKKEGFCFEIETNATLMPSKEFDLLISQYNCSPKLNNSKNPIALTDNKEALQFFAKSPKANFKFVVVSPYDLEELSTLVKRYQITEEKIYLMPEGANSEVLRERMKWLEGICKETRFRLTDRLHIHIHGPKRGV